MGCSYEALYEKQRDAIINDCTKCGKCITDCRVHDYLDIKDSPAEIQGSIIEYLKGNGELSEDADLKINSCMLCFGCLDKKCPIDLTSMRINELAFREREKRKEKPWDMTVYPVHNELAKKHTTENEYKRITTEVDKESADVLFFPGCNVYKQPEKIINALTIMDAIGNEYSFLPGLSNCCGWSLPGSNGDAAWIQSEAEELMKKAESMNASKMIFWCPTCMCIVKDKIERFYDIELECMTFGEYIYENINELKFVNPIEKKVTYHEPCKSTYLGIDVDDNSVRKILKAIPGTEVVEMKHHGEDVKCCGCAAVVANYEVGDRVTVDRLQEAIDTGAEALIDVCHNCHWIFKPSQKAHANLKDKIDIVNYSNYILEAMGIQTKDSLE